LGVAASLLIACVACGRPRTTTLEPSKGAASKSLGVPATRGGELVELDLTAGAPESGAGGGLFGVSAERTYTGLVRSIERAKADTDVAGLFVRLGAADLGWAHSEELGRMLADFRATHRPVVCHAHGLGNAGSWFALRACDRIWLSPAGGVETIGIAAQMMYFRGLFDKLGVHADFLSAGKYKSFAESFTREEPSQEARESLTAVLASIRSSWLDGARKARPDAPGLGERLEQGPWTPEEARSMKLVDAVGYESQAIDDAKQRAKASSTSVKFGPGAGGDRSLGVTDIVRMLAGADDDAGSRSHVAIVAAQGGITMQSGGVFEAGGITARALTRTLRRLKSKESVRAVVLRIDSPGGSALASDLIWHEVMELKKAKPVVASVGEMAASGGYYIACASNRILAEKTSIVGSIGVVGGKMSIGDALSRFGVTSSTIAANPAPGSAERAAYLSMLSPWDEATRERVKKQIDGMYGLFVARVAEGRHRPVAQVQAAAEGRIWTGAQALERGLIDEIGDLGRAIEIARKLGGLPDDAPASVEGSGENILENLLVGDDANSTEVKAALERRAVQGLGLLSSIPRELWPFVESFEPLAQGEHVVAALPISIDIR
jgi:protease-4